MLFDNVFDFTGHQLNIKEGSNGASVIELDVPGATRDQITLDYESGRLRVAAKFRGRQLEEYFTVPERIYDPNRLSASLKDGVLSIEVPKREGSATFKKIEIK